MIDFVEMDHLSTENTTLYWGFTKSGEVGLLYFTMADIYSHSIITFRLQDLENICEFLDDFNHEPVCITQIYTTRHNGVPLRCQVKLEYVETEKTAIGKTACLTFYDDYTEVDPEKDEDILSISSWKQAGNWDKFEKFGDFIQVVRDFWRSNL